MPYWAGEHRRGYNIAALLIDENGCIVSRELNMVLEAQDCTQHAEMRLIQGYIAKNKCFNLAGYTVYTTLEPCAMCAATMAMAGIAKVIYGQDDKCFGGAAKKLQLHDGGYPRNFVYIKDNSYLTQALDSAFERSEYKEITKWLASDEAKKIFDDYFSKVTMQ